jgi:hypothetical protein
VITSLGGLLNTRPDTLSGGTLLFHYDDAFVFDKDANGVNEYWIDTGFEQACDRAEGTFGAVRPGGTIWHDLRRTLQPDCEHMVFTSTTFRIFLGIQNRE